MLCFVYKIPLSVLSPTGAVTGFMHNMLVKLQQEKKQLQQAQAELHAQQQQLCLHQGTYEEQRCACQQTAKPLRQRVEKIAQQSCRCEEEAHIKESQQHATQYAPCRPKKASA